MTDEGKIVIRNARVNNLKGINLEIPRNRFVVITGISGSGKSSLAFDTLFAEGQRRFAQSLSSYARQFLGRMTKPEADLIEGIPPAIAIEQKVNVRNPRSTVATTTEIYDYLRLVFARVGHVFSPVSGVEVKCHSVADVVHFVLSGGCDSAMLLADLNWRNRTDKVELLLSLKEQGYSRLWVNGPVRIEELMRASEKGDFPDVAYLLVDRISLPVMMDGTPYGEEGEPLPKADWEDFQARLHSSVENCFSMGGGRMYVVKGDEMEKFTDSFEVDGMVFRKPDEFMFSFNSPLGACPECGGLGRIIGISEDLVVPDKSKTLYDGAIACWRGEKMGWFKDHLIEVAPRYGIRVFTPYEELTGKEKDILWNGHSVDGDEGSIVGIGEFFKWVEQNRYKIQYKYMLSRFSGRTVCHACKGSRLRKEALYVKVGGKDIHQLLCMNADELINFFRTLKLSDYEFAIARRPIEEIVSRLKCIKQVGLSYLTMNRNCNSLSGGESQRVNLVTALGSSLVGSMYILDEPSIGLHPRDTDMLVEVLRRLRDVGNTVIVVEHDEEIIRSADRLIDMGPMAGVNGGEVVFQGSLNEGVVSRESVSRSLTLQYVCGDRRIPLREKRPWIYSICVEGAREHNLKNIDVHFPLGVLTVVSGVSGSGKSSLVGDILYPALFRHINQTGAPPGIFRGLSGNVDRVDRVEYVDQNPIGRSARSNAVTYLKVYDDIRKLLAEQQYAKINGYTPSYFSFNQEGGRCSECQGEGRIKISMQFMADVTMTCEACGGKRFKPDILEVKYRGLNVDDILNLSVEEAIAFFGAGENELTKSIARKLQPLVDVGLSYIKLGQSSSTLSGGESQRIKLAYFLSMNEEMGPGKRIMFIFDEPTTGLHFYDVEKLLNSFDALLARGHSVVVVEHNLDVIKAADWVIDLGPEGGDGGGELVFAGTPELLLTCERSHTSAYLRKLGK